MLPKQFKHAKAATQEVGKKTPQNSFLTTKYRYERLLHNFSVSGAVLFCKFCQHKADKDFCNNVGFSQTKILTTYCIIDIKDLECIIFSVLKLWDGQTSYEQLTVNRQ